MNDNRKNRVFLSYASEDLSKVREVYEGLKKRGLDVWFDEEDLKPGRWHPQIEKAMEQSRYFVICLSKSAIKKIGHTYPGYQKEEVSFALKIAMEQPETEFTIVPIRIMRLEESARGGYQLSPFQQYDLFDNFDKGLDKLAVDMGGKSLSDPKAKDVRREDKKLIDSLMARAETEFYAGRYKESVSFLESVLTISPNKFISWVNMGVVLWQLNREREALEAYDKALKINRDDSRVWYYKGNALSKLKRFEEALKAYDEALDIDPGNASVWKSKGDTLLYLGRYEEALEAFEKALDINSEIAQAWKGKGHALINLGLTKEAMAAFRSLHSKSYDIDD
jgi:tetratricopeptide (TPR) repeat protein